MKPLFKYFILALLLTTLTGLSVEAAENYKDGEVIVVMKEPANVYRTMSAGAYSAAAEAHSASFARKKGLSAVCSYPALSQNSGCSFAFFKSDDKTTAEIIEELKNDPDVLSVSPNYKRKLAALPNDPMLGDQRGLNDINIFGVWDKCYAEAGRTVYVAVLDSGVDYTHEDLKDNLAEDGSGGIIGRHFYRDGDKISHNDDFTDIYGHGTHVAGIIGAAGNNGKGVAGVHWKNVRIIPVKVTDDEGGTDDALLLRGVEYVLGLNNLNIKIVNMSLGGWSPALTPEAEKSNALRGLLKTLSDRGMIITVAAGNHGQNLSNPGGEFEGKRVYPACYTDIENKITVGSIGPDSNKSDFSNYGAEYVDIAAPGEGIRSTLRGGDYGDMKGTSMSTPFVAGVAALLFSAFPDKSAAEIKAAILNGASGGGDTYWKNGLLNAEGAYSARDGNVSGNGSSGCNVGAAILSVPFALFIFMAVRRKRRL